VRAILAWLDGAAPTSWIVLGVLFVVIVYLIVRLVRKRAMPRTAAGTPPKLESKEDHREGTKEVTDSFRAARRVLNSLRGRVRHAYETPLVMIMGAPGSGKTALLRGAGLPSAAPEHVQGQLRWSFFDRGVVLEAPGGFIGRSTDDRHARAGWKRFLRSLVRQRPERALDSVVLTVSVDDLNLGPDQVGTIQRQGELLYQRLKELQDAAALRFPVYLVVTHCDRIPGFGSFAGSLTSTERAGMLGWASPYGPDTAFSDSWVEEAVSCVREGLLDSAVSLSTRVSPNNRDGLFLLAQRFSRLTAPVRALLSQTFKESAYHDGFFLRGIFFTGTPASEVVRVSADSTVAGPEVDAERSPPPPGNQPPAFFRDLLVNGVFAEQGLARAQFRGLLARGRTVRFLQIAAALGLLGGPFALLMGQRALSQKIANVDVLLQEAEADLQTIQLARTSHTVRTLVAFEVTPLLTGIAKISSHRATSLFIPPSWFSGVHGEIEDAIGRAFEEIILPALREGLVADIGELVSADSAGVARADTMLSARGELTRSLRRIAALSSAIQHFNGIAETDHGDLEDLASVVAFVFGETLPAEFRQGDTYYREALSSATIDPLTTAEFPRFPDAVQRTLFDLTNASYADVVGSLDALATTLERAGSPDNTDGRSLAELAADIQALENVTLGAEQFWLDPSADVGPPITSILDSIPETAVLSGPKLNVDYVQGFGQIRDTQLGTLRTKAAAYRIEFGEPLLTEEGRALRLSPRVKGIQDSLEEVLALGIFTPLPGQAARGLGSVGSRPSWNLVPLDLAVQRVAAYRTFSQGQLDSLPDALRAAVQGALVPAFNSRVQEALVRAMTYQIRALPTGSRGVEEDLRERSAAFDAAGARLVTLLDAAEQFQAGQSSDRIARVLILESFDLLDSATDLASKGDPYGASFTAWTGNRPAAFAATGTPDLAALAAYLVQEKQSLGEIANNYVKPVLGFLDLPPIQTLLRKEGASTLSSAQLQEFQSWKATVTALDQDAAQKPGNPVQLLEKFFRTSLMAVSPADCGSRVSGESGVSGVDIFSRAHQRLIADFSSRCLELVRARLTTGYGALVAFHARALTSRFPFGDPRTTTLDADLGAIRRFFSLYDSGVAPYLGALPLLQGASGGSEFSSFLHDLDDARGVFAPFLQPNDTVTHAAGALEYEVEFRTNRTQENGAEQIVDWSWRSGNKESHYGDSIAARTGLWRPHDPVTVALRWATQSRVKPAPPAGDGGPTVDGRVAKFQVRSTWSLLRLTAVYRSTAVAPPGGGWSVLGFQTPIEWVNPPTDNTLEPAVVFIRVQLRHPQTKEWVSLPVLPATLPPFPGS
jgi:type VI secretion system protein ImpL